MAPFTNISSGRGRFARFAAVAGLLVLLLPLTWLVRQGYVARVEAESQARQHDAVTAALDEIEASWKSMQRDLLGRAEAIADAPDIVSGLRTRIRSGLTLGPESLVDYFASLEIPYGTSVELYDGRLQLVAWNGFSMRVAAPPPLPSAMESFRTNVTVDDDVRQALVVWWPVRDGSRVVGVVRAMHLVAYDAPIRNEYIRDVSLVDQWRRLTDLPVSLTFDTSLESAERSLLLQGADGSVLGRVSVDPPSPEQLVADVSARFDHVLAFWTVLLLFWLMGGAWHAYRLRLEALPSLPRGRPVWRAAGAFGAVATLWWLIRFALLELDVPGRWQQDKAPLAPLFDPLHFASGMGGGLLRSTGDFLITSLFLLVFAIAFLELAGLFRNRSAHLYRVRRRLRLPSRPPGRSTAVLAAAVGAGSVVVIGLTFVLALAARHVVMDSTFDFFARSGLLPDVLLLVVFCTLILAAIGIVLIALGAVWIASTAVVRHAPTDAGAWTFWLSAGLAATVPLVILYAATPIGAVLPWTVSVSMIGLAFSLAAYAIRRTRSVTDFFMLRTILPSLFLVTVLVYPMLYSGMDAKRRVQMIDAAETFSEGRDPRVLFGLERLLRDARTNDHVQAVLAGRAAGGLDSVATSAFRGSLLASLPAYDVSLTIFDAAGGAVGSFFDTGQVLDPAALAQIEPLERHILHQMYEEAGGSGVVTAPVTGLREPGRFQFEGIAPVVGSEAQDTLGWVTARAEPQSLLSDGGTPFPRVLLPSGSYDDLFATLSIAEFRDGLLVRTMGRDFGRFRLPDEVMQTLAAEGSVWRREEVEERDYRTYYVRRVVHPQPNLTTALLPASATTVVGVRAPSVNTFDHLYYLLRLTVAGLFIALPLYLFGLVVRRRHGLLPAPRVRFRDKVLNAFLGVGIISVAAVGFVGLGVVTDENERAVQSWLRQHLERVEETLALDARGEEMPYSVLGRAPIDSLAARVGLDLNVYSGQRLVDLSRPQLVRDRLIDRRLPIEAFDALYFEGYRFTYTEEQVGNFTYTTGFRALPDEQGRPRYVISVPTLPEQERIEEERARTVAYLFGSLLLLVLVVMLTASLLANAISRPIARLRSGLKAVAAGRFERPLPVDSRDEIGELVETFNDMQHQLAESRRKLAQQERQLAWREMARQVAHEIKNPLTPMKLSVQHLQRAFKHKDEDPDMQQKFAKAFDRITETLVEQIDTLARIANEFHSFARMPSRVLEYVDLNAVLEEAVALMQEESDVKIELHLCRERLVVEVDREELRRNYINLIKNAIQAIAEPDEGCVEVRSERQVDAEGVWAYSSVSDNGTGVSEDVRGRVFEPNFSTKTSGTGLGLAIVKKSIEELQGEIDFETEEGVGTTFWIRLPLVGEG